MKNVLLISDYAAPYKGNFIPSLEAIERHIGEKNHVVYVFPSVAQEQVWIPAFEKNHTVVYIDRMFFSKYPQWKILAYLRKVCRRYHITTIHTHFVEGNINMWLLRRLSGVQCVANLHNHYKVSGRLGVVRKYLFRWTNDVVIGDSASVSESAYAIGVPQRKVVTINNSIDFTRLDDYTPVEVRQGQEKVVLMFGYPWYRKGVDITVRAIALLQKTGTNIRLAIAQSGKVEQTKQGITQTIGEVPAWVTFLPPTDRLADYYSACDVFLSAGREEGLSYSPIEAAYCSCGVVCSRIGGNPLDIPGIGIYDTEDVEALAAALQVQFSLSAEDRRLRNEKQKKYVLANYNVEDWAERVVETYQ